MPEKVMHLDGNQVAFDSASARRELSRLLPESIIARCATQHRNTNRWTHKAFITEALGGPIMAKNTQQTTDVDTLVAAITAALGGGQFSTPTAVAEKVAEATTFDPKEFAEDQGFALNRGRVTLNADTLKAAQRVLKSGKPEIVEAGGERNSHLVVFRGEHGVSLHNARKA